VSRVLPDDNTLLAATRPVAGAPAPLQHPRDCSNHTTRSKSAFPATLRRNVQATPARLRRISRIDLDYQPSSVCSFLGNQTSKNPKSRIEPV
jgi:hypothetical protein